MSHLSPLQLIVLIILCSLRLNQAASEVYYITTNSTDHCNVQLPCLTLSQFAINSSHYLHSNTTLVFLPGAHHLSEVNLTVSNVEEFVMKSESLTVKIKCTSDSSMYFSQSHSIHITNLEFIGCGGNQVKNIEEFLVNSTKFEGQENSKTALELIETSSRIVNSTFVSNRKGSYRIFPMHGFQFVGGAIIATSSTSDNRASKHIGGVLWSFNCSTIVIEASEFRHNTAVGGSVLASLNSFITIKASQFDSNKGTGGTIGAGVLYFYNRSNNVVKIERSEFNSNSGTVLYSESSTITLSDCNFTNNSSPVGAVIYANAHTTIQYHNRLLIDDNSANDYAAIYLSQSEFRGNDSGHLTFSNNVGSMLMFNSNITFSGFAKFVNNQPSNITTDDFESGGALALFQSNVFFDGVCYFEHNHAGNGGAIHSTESKLYVNGNVTIAHNTATGNGGGVYLSTSEINCQQESTLMLYNNTAAFRGGGIHAISSSVKASHNIGFYDIRVVYIGARVNFTKNIAKLGGGLSLEANAKLYILKYYDPLDIYNAVLFISNGADYGGAVYVDDNTNSGTCASEPRIKCFFQVLAVYDYNGALNINFSTQCMHFSRNHAKSSGSILFGGLLDRCAVSPFAEIHKKYHTPNSTGGVSYFKNVSYATDDTISSDPVQVCLCTKFNDMDKCVNQNENRYVKKGETLLISLMAIDQVGTPVSAIIRTSLNYSDSGLAEGQLERNVSTECTKLNFNVVSPHDSEKLILYASDGPCKDTKLSRATVEIHFLPCSCPIGFQVSGMNNTNCTCECHSNISRYMEQCDSHTGLLIKKPQSRAWISYINDSNLTGYLVYPNCPFDYCLSTSSPFDLNQPNGADAQCAFNRSSLLCGSCQPGLSLSLGSSRCLPCPSYWSALLIVITITAILVGIALIAVILLVLNMTVAVGTLNGLISYINVVYANKSILLPFQETNFIIVFTSWLNWELAFDTCYFSGMDTYLKTWLQLALPAYAILLVVLVIIISSYSTKFSNLIGKKDPVATLATLILLSYAKLVEICFKSLSVGILEYPDGSSEMLWLPDATVKYLSGKHIPLFIAAVLILLVGLVYTALLFSWQWLLRLSEWRIFKQWSSNPKIQTFIETYHAPYTAKHRYWTGLLLISRVFLYLIVAANRSNDPTIALTAITLTVGSIVLLKGLIATRVYKNWLLDILESFFYLNIFFYMVLTWYYFSKPNHVDQVVAVLQMFT